MALSISLGFILFRLTAESYLHGSIAVFFMIASAFPTYMCLVPPGTV